MKCRVCGSEEHVEACCPQRRNGASSSSGPGGGLPAFHVTPAAAAAFGGTQ
jgi:hypothetical protein